jgi:pimeloyl-ACP methyl ester carboxylesterase
VRLAWSEAGSGPLLVKAANWLTHLEYDCVSPLWRHWISFFAGITRFVRYDERGCGMTDWKVDDLSLERWIEDLEAVIDVAAPEQPVSLLGISQGSAVCIAYAVRHPERVSSLVLYGGYARGSRHRADALKKREYEAIIELCRTSWGSDNAAFREVFTSRFVPGASRAQIDWFNELCRKTTSSEMAAALLHARANVTVADDLSKVRAPTLVLHAREDAVVPFSEGRELAAGIAGAEFVELDSKNHVLLDHEPAWERFCDAVRDFLRVGQPHGAFAALTDRERDVLVCMARGLTNVEIGNDLFISEKTVRNHVTKIFEKLGVHSRAQAIVMAKDAGLTR